MTSWIWNKRTCKSPRVKQRLDPTLSHEPNRDLKTKVLHQANDSLISEYTYSYDNLGRRTDVQTRTTALAHQRFNLYNYNDRNELTAANRYEGVVITDFTNPVEAENRSYQYDAIGNRDTATIGGGGSQIDIDYTANALNQYEDITGGTITDLDFDEDGNMVGYNKNGKSLSLTFNAENRLINIEPVSPANGDTRSEFLYDYLGRRVKKTVYAYDGGAWQEQDTKLFVWDGWNMIAELDENEQVEAAYVWGLDLSQSLQGAGGIGGLIARVDVPQDKIHLYTFDANGNVGQLIDAADGSIAAAYHYSPFGQMISSSGPMANINPFRWSTKFTDDETGLVYYGFRFYIPQLGMWNRIDPLGEKGGLNLYGFVGGDPVNLIDPAGLHGFPAPTTGKPCMSAGSCHYNPNQHNYQSPPGSIMDKNWSISLYGGGGAEFTNEFVECCKGDKKYRYHITIQCGGVGFGTDIPNPTAPSGKSAAAGTSDRCPKNGDWFVAKSGIATAGRGAGYQIEFGTRGIRGDLSYKKGAVGAEVVPLKICTIAVWSVEEIGSCCDE